MNTLYKKSLTFAKNILVRHRGKLNATNVMFSKIDEKAKRMSLMKRFWSRFERISIMRNLFLKIEQISATLKANIMAKGARAELIKSSVDIIVDWMGLGKSQKHKTLFDLLSVVHWILLLEWLSERK